MDKLLIDSAKAEISKKVTENAQSGTFKAPCCSFEYTPYTTLSAV